MKFPTLVSAAILIAGISGGTGYWLGTHKPLSGATQNPVAANPQSPNRNLLVRNRGDDSGITDFKQLRAQLDGEADTLARFKTAMRHLEAWMDSDPEDALDWLTGEPASIRRNDVIRMALGQFAEKNPKGAAEWAMANLNGAELNNTLIMIAEQWALRDGRQAADWLTALPAARERDAAMETLLFSWAAEDPAAAVAYLQQAQDSEELSATLRYAAYAGWAKIDPPSAVAASLESSRRHQDPAQFANTLANWATLDLAASTDWLLANVTDAAERSAAIQELAGIYAHQSPEAGLEWFAKLAPGSERAGAMNRFATEWAVADPAAAALWTVQQSPGTIGEETVSEILFGFLIDDLPGYDAWRATLPDGPMKTRAEEIREMNEGSDE